MDERVLSAAANNAQWCDLVCRSHGIPTAFDERVWVALRRAPEFYPDVVTLVPGVVAEELPASVLDAPGAYVKDSFADLDLGPCGYEELFEAQWIFRAPAAAPRGRGLDWTSVETEQRLVEWTEAAGLTGILPGGLLRDPAVRFLAARTADGLAAGAIAHRTGSVAGVSNVFARTVTTEEAWDGLADAANAVFRSLPLVGYESGDPLQAALAAGFIAIGELRVWKDANAPALSS